MSKLIAIAMATALAGCINLGVSDSILVRERCVTVTATGFESLPVGSYKLLVEAIPAKAWYTGTLTVTEDRHYVLRPTENEEAK